MGEAKRRKKLDPNYGAEKFRLEFLSESESNILVRNELKDFATKQNTKYYFIQLITENISIIGVALPFVIGTEIHVKCVWQRLDNKSSQFQNRIINRHLPQVTKKVALRLKSELRKK